MRHHTYCDLCHETYHEDNLLTCQRCQREFCYRCLESFGAVNAAAIDHENDRGALAKGVQELIEELAQLDALDRHKAHARTCYGFGDGFGIAETIFVGFDVGLYILQRHQFYLVSLLP